MSFRGILGGHVGAGRGVLRLALVACLLEVAVAELEVLLGVRECVRWCALWRVGSGFVLLSTLSVSLDGAGSAEFCGYCAVSVISV